MALSALLVAILGVTLTIVLFIRSNRLDNEAKALTRRNEAIITANKSKEEVKQIERLLEDLERSHEKRGVVVQRADGSWGIDWSIAVGGGSVGLTAGVTAKVKKNKNKKK